MSSSSTVTYTSVYSDSEPWRFQWVSDDELEAPEEAPQSPGQAPPSSDYVPGLEHPPSPDYVLGPKEPEQEKLSPDYVPELKYPEYLVPFDAEAPIEDHPLPYDASPIALSPGYVDYPADVGDDNDDDESSDDDDDDDDEEEEEEEEHLRQTSLHLHHHHPDLAGLGYMFDPRHRWQHLLRHSSLNSLTTITLSSPPTHTSPTYAEAPLGYRAVRIRLRAASPPTHHLSKIPSPPLLLPSTTHRDDIHEADMPLRKRAHFTVPTGRFEVGESSPVAAARQHGLDVATVDATPRRPMSREVGYGIEDVWDDMVGDMEERAHTTIKGLSQRVTNLSTTLVGHAFREAVVETPGSIGDMPWTATGRYMLSSKHIELKFRYMRLIFRHERLIREMSMFKELVRTAKEGPQDGPADAGSSFVYFTKISPKRTTATTTPAPMTNAQIKELIAQGVADALAEIEANRTSKNGDDNHDSGIGSRRTE
ncbi:hypothetical protein Tco_1425863 [Tanacetum coccineum]